MNIFVPKEQAQARYDICKRCEYFSKTSTICKQCHCIMKFKVTLASSECPVEKWKKHEI